MAVAFGRYELLKKIASGGMGQVFLGRTATQGFEKLVVIKRILPHLVEDEEFLAMFFDEARIAARLNHPNLAQIFDLGEVNGMHYLAMEYVAGEDVRRVEKAARRKGQTIPLGAACRIVSDAAAGLDYAHKLKDPQGAPLHLIHRDVSPQNVLVGFDGGVKLIDFGVARAAGRAQHTATGILKGKYPYMSPEQIRGEEYDHRSDQFALGTLFWEILTGKRLFKGENDLVTMRLVRECVVPVPSSLKPEIPKALDDLVLKALSPKASDRFRDCEELRMALEDFIVREHVTASAAHLSAFMRTLYAERIEREADLSSLDELSGPNAFEEESWPSDSRFDQKGGSPPPANPGPGRTVGGTQPLTRPGAGRRFPVAAVLAGALVLGAGAVAIPFLLPEEPPEVPAPAPVAAAPTPPAPVPAPEPEPVRLRLVSEPPGAEVTVAGTNVGTSPVEYLLDPEATQVVATFSLDGYETHRALLTPDRAPAVTVTLKAKPRPRKRPDDRKKDPPDLGIKTGR